MNDETDRKIKRELKFVLMGADEAGQYWDEKDYESCLRELTDIIDASRNLMRLIQPMADAQDDSDNE